MVEEPVQGSGIGTSPAEGARTEADVELNVLTPILMGANYLDIPQDSIRAKDYLHATTLDKVAGKAGGYYPDYSVWEKALPVMIVEAKSPEVDPEVGYREASLYARHLNQKYRSDLNPCRFILSCNGLRILVGTWDSGPTVDAAIADLRVGSEPLERLRAFCAYPVLSNFAARCLAALRPVRATLPYNRAGGQALINSTKPFNTFAAELAPLLRRYFTSTSQNSDREIYERGYVNTADVTTYDKIMESLLKERITTRRGSLTQDITPTRSSEPKLSAVIDDFRQRDVEKGNSN